MDSIFIVQYFCKNDWDHWTMCFYCSFLINYRMWRTPSSRARRGCIVGAFSRLGLHSRLKSLRLLGVTAGTERVWTHLRGLRRAPLEASALSATNDKPPTKPACHQALGPPALQLLQTNCILLAFLEIYQKWQYYICTLHIIPILYKILILSLSLCKSEKDKKLHFNALQILLTNYICIHYIINMTTKLKNNHENTSALIHNLVTNRLLYCNVM